MNKEPRNSVSYLPNEILFHIFNYLPAKPLIKCREVCVRWKQLIDYFFLDEIIWERFCKCDFSECMLISAREKALPCLSWYDLYKSLSLWPRLSHASEEYDEFASASILYDEILNFQTLRNGVIAVRTKSGINYYNIEKQQKAKRKVIQGHFTRYLEIDDVLIMQNELLNLFIIRMAPCDKEESRITFGDVKSFVAYNKTVYFVNLNDEIYACDLESKSFKTVYLQQPEDCVMILGHHNNELFVLTYEKNIFKVDSKALTLICTLDNKTNLLHTLNKYNFLDYIDWYAYYRWMYTLNHNIPQGPLTEIVTVRSYGDVYFVGTNWGVLRIYYAPYTNGEIDIFSHEPVKQYNFMEREDCPVLSVCPVLQIDAVEIHNGHMVLIAMPKKIVVLKFKHNFKVEHSSDVLQSLNAVKQLKITTS